MQRTGWAGRTAPSGLACFDASMLLQGNLDRGPANSFPTTPPSPNGDGAGSKPPGSVAKCQRLRTSLVLARAVLPPLLSARLSLLDALQDWDGSKPIPLSGKQHFGGFHQVWIQLRCRATKIPSWHERTTRLRLPAASPGTWTPPSSPYPPGGPQPFARCQGRRELVAQGAGAGGAAAACRRLWESRGSSHSPCGAWLGAPCPRGPHSCWGGRHTLFPGRA